MIPVFEGMDFDQAAGVLHLSNEMPECAMPSLEVGPEIVPNATWNLVGASHPPAHAALTYAEVASERRLPLLAVDKFANAFEEFFAQEGLLPSFVGGANLIPFRSGI
jgi:hypothetical protein